MTDEEDGPPTLSFTTDHDLKRLDPIVEEKKRGWENPNVCEHIRGAFLDRAARTIECKTCGALLDAFEYLFIIQRRWNQIESRVEMIQEHKRKEAARAERELARREARKARPR